MSDVNNADVDALDALMASQGWIVLGNRLSMQLERERSALENGPPDISAVERSRGSIRALRMMMELPQAMRKELAGGACGKKS